jgi:hypothetical protein
MYDIATCFKVSGLFLFGRKNLTGSGGRSPQGDECNMSKRNGRKVFEPKRIGTTEDGIPLLSPPRVYPAPVLEERVIVPEFRTSVIAGATEEDMWKHPLVKDNLRLMEILEKARPHDEYTKVKVALTDYDIRTLQVAMEHAVRRTVKALALCAQGKPDARV